MALKKKLVLSVILVLVGCASFQAGSQILAGRQALITNNPERALAYFQQVAQTDPNYIYTSGLYREGVWTYLGRAQYAMGKLEDARQSFERALSVYKDDYLARLYLGLTLLRNGDQSRGLKEVEAGLKGLYDWLEYMNYSRPHEAFWDPRRQIRSEIEKTLAMISGKDTDLQKLIENAEWIGMEMEKEIDRVRQDEKRFYDRQFERERERGMSVGVGIGF
jgi:tetratricopeptide (TPR) repeat protein